MVLLEREDRTYSSSVGEGDTFLERRNFLMPAGIGLVFLLSIAVFIGIYIQTFPSRDMPMAKRGVLDLSSWDFQSQGLVNLDGEWEIYPGELLSPEDFRRGQHANISYLVVPGTWKGDSVIDSIDRKGAATYRLHVKLPEDRQIYGLKTKSIRMSHRLFLNGNEEGTSGHPAVVSEAHQPGNTPYTVFFFADDKDLEIVIQVANFMFFTGGIASSIQLGLDEDIAILNSTLLGTDIAFVVTLGIMAAYHLSFYFLRMRERTYLFSGSYMIVLGIYHMVFGEKMLLQLFPSIPFTVAYKAQDASLFASTILLALFFCSIDTRVLSRNWLVKLTAPIFLYILVILVLPYSFYTNLKGPLLIYVQMIHFFIMGRLIYLSGKSQRDSSDRKELLLFIGASISLSVSLIDGLLYAENIVPTDFAGKIGILYFITFINILLAVRFTNAYEKTEILSHQLKISNQIKDEFLTHTSHEMKTPLHGIINITSHLLEDESNMLSSKQRQNLWLVKDTSIKLSMLVGDLLDVTRLKHGELRLHFSIVDIKVITQIVFDVLQFELLGKDVWLENQVPANIWVYADENRLRQIMYNLVHNAIKHTNVGSIKVMAGVVGGQVRISVEDTGIGIAPDKHEAIFDYFEQVDQLLPQDGYTGMGVGLYINRKLVELMGGEIWVESSELGKGTRMTFTLATGHQQMVTQELAATAQERQREVSEQIPLNILDDHQYTIMIVDDEASNIHTLLNILSKHRYNVISAFSAKEAMKKIKEHPQPDLVILDVMMPGVSGIELCQLLRTQYSILDLPILFASVRDTPQDLALGYRAGANDYVTKPFDAETLIARVQTLISMKTSIQEAIRNEHAFHQAQIKPHFLYNALSSVISFCYTDGEKAAYLITMLSQYLRYILDMDRTTLFVPLFREMELIHAYVEIEKARFGEGFDFVCHVDEGILDKEIPSLSIQPFVENAIRHGLFEKDEKGHVTLTIVDGGHYIKVMIEDDGVGIADDLLYQMSKGENQKGSIGIQNIRRRLDTIPGATLSITSEMGKGTKVVMYIPTPEGMHVTIA
ncbi:ATP-binding protein [Brevibacillus sp. BC25]|uniref:ATP-binding protein n=1 Tax=Brevibacillus sp. BC25 TaxID=1144308 RepID=UPI0002711A4B|nr:ATP-binding protein [Brevibacillus sp. BC25]EJL27646.1 signal transduction histidine kinase [Brevibacillus sp. BC25]